MYPNPNIGYTFLLKMYNFTIAILNSLSFIIIYWNICIILYTFFLFLVILKSSAFRDDILAALFFCLGR